MRPEHRTLAMSCAGYAARSLDGEQPPAWQGGGAHTQVPLRCLPGAWIHSMANRKRPNHPAAMMRHVTTPDGQEGGGERNSEVTTEDGARAGLGQPAERIQHAKNDCEDPRDQPGCHQDAPQSLSSLRARPAASARRARLTASSLLSPRGRPSAAHHIQSPARRLSRTLVLPAVTGCSVGRGSVRCSAR
jgi:hypothetical protein